MKTSSLLLFLLLNTALIAQSTDIPDWFLKDLEANVGTWMTDNSKYLSEEEPYDEYVIEWTWGIGKTSIIGKLFGVAEGKPSGEFWQFRQYWDNMAKKAMLVQYGFGGAMGVGPLHPLDANTIEVIQLFSSPDGSNYLTKHISEMRDNSLITTSYEKTDSDEWEVRRSYVWFKQ